MLSVIKRIVLINILILFSFSNAKSTSENAIDIKIKNILNEDIALSKYTIIELPFLIEKKNLRVIMKKKVEKQNTFNNKLNQLNYNLSNNKTNVQDKNLLTDKKPPLPDANNKVVKTPIKNSHSSNKIKIFKNYIEVFPKELGVIEIIIFGGSKPLILTLNVKKDIDIKYLLFEDSAKKTKTENIDFNLNSNKKALFLNYFRFLYTNKDIPNFEKLDIFEKKQFFDGKLQSVLSKAYKNDKYIIKEYLITNNLPLNFYIEEDLFKNENTKAISFVSQDNFIYKDEITRYFIIDEL